MISFSIARTSLSLSPLVISDDPAGAYVFDDADDIPRPSFDYVRSYAPDSQIFRRELLRAKREAVDVPMGVKVQGTSAADFEAKKLALEVALSQFVWDGTLTHDGQATTYECEVCAPAWSQDSGMLRQHMAKATITVPINPPGA